MDRKRRIILSASIIAIAAGAGQLVQSNRGPVVETAAPTSVVMLSAKAGPEVAGNAAPAVAATPFAAATTVPAFQRDIHPPLSDTAKAAPEPVVAPPGAPLAAAPSQPPVAAAVPSAPVPLVATPLPAAPAPIKTAVSAQDPALPATLPLASAAPAEPTVLADACATSLSATALPGAVLSLALVAPCDGGARVVMRHGGLAVTGKLSDAGTMFTTLPAMEAAGEVTAMFPDGSSTTAPASADLTGIRRMAVQWQGDDAFQLQVYEDGAVFGAPGNLSAAQPVGAGRVDVLGDATVDLPMLAQVYTWPATPLPVQVTIEAAVTAATCDREILSEAVESVEGRVTATDITLAMPDCGGIGDFLVLNNLPGGTTLAAAE